MSLRGMNVKEPRLFCRAFGQFCLHQGFKFWGGGGGGQPDSDVKVDIAKIGIKKIGIFNLFTFLSFFLANCGEIGNKKFFGISYFFTRNPLELSEYSVLS